MGYRQGNLRAHAHAQHLERDQPLCAAEAKRFAEQPIAALGWQGLGGGMKVRGWDWGSPARGEGVGVRARLMGLGWCLRTPLRASGIGWWCCGERW